VNARFEEMLQHRRSLLDGAVRAMTARNCTKRTITPSWPPIRAGQPGAWINLYDQPIPACGRRWSASCNRGRIETQLVARGRSIKDLYKQNWHFAVQVASSLTGESARRPAPYFRNANRMSKCRKNWLFFLCRV